MGEGWEGVMYAADSARTRRLRQNLRLPNGGRCILRFCNSDVLANLDGVHETIVGELGSRITPTQTLPHQGGGLSSEI